MLQELTVGFTLFGCGMYIGWLYMWLATIEPFCFYLPGGLGRYYKVHENITTKFDDIIGSESIKKEIQGHLKFFTEKKLSKGFFFHGPSGSGKTMMARAIAGESNIPFIEVFCENINDSGKIPTVINAIVKNKKYKPCIIFIDECTSIVSRIDDTILRRLDGMTSMENVIIILATHSKINSAIHRSGRIDKVIQFELPSYNNRKDMFLKMGYDESKSFQLAQRTNGFSYADIAVIPREREFISLIYQIKDEDEILNQVIDRLKFGRHTSKLQFNQNHRIRLAYHEVGHLITSYVLKGVNKPHKITLSPEGNLAGHVTLDIKDDTLKTKSDIVKLIAVFLASSVFETHFLGEYSTLCQDDFEKIEKLFEIMEKNMMLGYKFLFISDKKKKDNIKTIIDDLTNHIKQIIQEYRFAIEEIHSRLLTQETLNKEEIEDILGLDLLDSYNL